MVTAGALSSASYIATGNITGGNLITAGSVSGTLEYAVTMAVSGTGLSGSASYNNSGAATFTVTSNATSVNTISTIVARDGSGNFSAGTISALSTSAQYADMAERFHADAEYSAGTVVELGGINEVTLCQDDLSNTVFGVVSTKAAYLMNGGAGTNETHPPIAMSGRVPVNVMGFITKGDRLVSAGNGVARSANLDEITSFNVIGRALESKTDEGLGSVEAIVKIV